MVGEVRRAPNWRATLHYAITTGDIDGFRKSIDQARRDDPSSDIVNTFLGQRGESLALLALEFDRMQIFSDLLELGADLSATDKSGRNALHYALGMESSKALELLLRRLDPAAVDRNGFTPLMSCAYSSAVDRRPYLVEHMRTILKAYRDVDAQNTAGMSAIRLACLVGFREAAELLVSHGADVHQVLEADGSSLLHTASEHGHLAAMGLLLDVGVAVDLQDRRGYTALHRALAIPTTAARRDAVALLIGAGADSKLVAGDNKCPQDFVDTYPELREVFDAGRARSAIDTVLRAHFPRRLMQKQ